MSDIAGYTITSTIDHRGSTFLAAGTRRFDGAAVLLKGGAPGTDSINLRARLRSEFERLSRATGVGVVEPLEFVTDGDRTVLVLDDDGSRPLRRLVGEPLTLAEFYRTAIGIAEAVEALHDRNIAHLGLSPDTILVSRNGSARLVHFDDSIVGGRQEQPMVPILGISGDLRYLAPEQTGRMLAAVDQQADLYSLGMSLYELLTGSSPFDAVDAPDLVYAHLAVAPTSIAEHRNDVPPELVAVFDRLLAKSPDHRYQSAHGVVYDLRQLAAGSTTTFVVASRDIAPELRFPDRLYGRDDELGDLLDAFTQADDGRPSLVLVAGESGAGKSRLVQGVAPLVVERNARWAEGKFEELRRDEPYLALADALGGLVQLALMEPEEQLAALREHLLTALAGNGSLLTGLVPGLSDLIGEQPAVDDLPISAADTRFRMIILSFTEAWARADRPVVLFLDDLQWADPSSLALVRALLGASDARILVVGAYRSNEVGPGHVLNDLIAAPEIADRTTTVVVGELEVDAVRQFVTDSLFPDAAAAAPGVEQLADTLHAKSGGNAFFLRQLIGDLVSTGTLGRDDEGRWRWDSDDLERWRPTDNVAQLMSERLQREIPGAIDTLGWAACLGFEFDLDVLTAASGIPIELIASHVSDAATGQFVRVRREAGVESFRFEHDRIQEAAYALLDDDRRRRCHLALGRTLRDSAHDDLEVIAATDQLNEAVDLITDPLERQSLIELNHRAGRSALASSSPDIARRYLETAMDLLGVGPATTWAGAAWSDDYERAVAIAGDTTKAQWLSGAFDDLVALADQMIAVAHDPLEMVATYDLLIQHHTNLTQHSQALDVGRTILAALGEPIPTSPGQPRVILAMLRMRRILGRRGPNEVRSLPAMSDETALAKMLLLNSMMNPAYFADPDAMAVMIFRMCELSLKYGNSPQSAFAWCNYGFVLCHILGNYERGNEFGAMAIDLAEQPEARQVRTRVQFTVTSLLAHWRTSVRQTYPQYRRAFQTGLEVGDLTYASLSWQLHTLAMLLSGEPLGEVRHEIDDARSWMIQQQQHQTLAMVDMYRQVAQNLQGEGASIVELSGPSWSAAERVADLEAGNDLTALAALSVSELWLAVIAGDPDRVALVSERVDESAIASALDGTVWVPLYHFLAGMAALQPGRRSDRRVAKHHLKKLKKWNHHAPESTTHRVLAIEAGLAQSGRRPQRAIKLYEQAAAAAHQSGAFLGDLGLICERAELACAHAGLDTAANVWRYHANRAYSRWGATTKLTETAADETGQDDDTLDMHALLQLSQAVAGELRLDELLRQILTIAMEVAGGRSGYLITQHDGQLFVVASGSHDGEIEVHGRIPLGEAPEVPDAIINYVARRRHSLILEDAAQKGPFVLDPFVRSRVLRSVLCAPVVTQGQIVALVYLENDLVAGAFKPERLDALRLLSTSAASALANATLVADLEELNTAYERFVPDHFLRLLDKPNIVDVRLGDGVERDVTVLFADVRGFTTLSEQLSPRETFRLVNDYLAVIAPVIEAHGGVIDKYIGDAVMALFPGDPGPAVRASLEILSALDIFNDQRDSDRLPRVEAGVGLHTGHLMLGTVGTRERMDGTVIGDAVNLSSRVEGLTKTYGARLLVTEATWAALDPLERPDARLVDRVRAAGTTRPISLYHVLTPVEVEALYTIDDFTAGCTAYFAADFATAERHLHEAQRRHPNDKAAQLLLARCRDFIQSGAPPDWDGVTTHTTK